MTPLSTAKTVIGNGCSHSRFSIVSPDQSTGYNWIDGVERLDKYKPSGYYPIMIDDLLNGQYRIVDKLEFGGYSTIWLAQDQRLKRYVAIKVGVSSPSLSRRKPRMLKESSLIRLFPIQIAQALAAKPAIAVAFIHSHRFVHRVADIHLRNVLVRLPSTSNGFSIDQFRKKLSKPKTVPLSRTDRSPLPPNISSCAVVPLYLGEKAQDFTFANAHGLVLNDFSKAFTPAIEQQALFKPNEILGMRFIFSESETQDEIMAQQIEVLGPQHIPSSYDRDRLIPRQPAGPRKVWPTPKEAFNEFVQKYRKNQETARDILKFQSNERLTIDEVLGSEWMVNWALPQLE
ncbi:hypothetical protein LY76DRAFT_622334 [Colletotrichum caudatum]|nr:hypothetical protein LY76DRAFT_622334 [Colletotrichum caudatum]